MKLTIVTPAEVVVEETGVTSLTAEDASGRFGIRPGHADFLTTLRISVVSWTGQDGARRHAAVREGVLRVTGGAEVNIATRDAVPGQPLETLSDTVLRRFEAQHDAERTEWADETRLHLAAIRQIVAGLSRRDRAGLGP